MDKDNKEEDVKKKEEQDQQKKKRRIGRPCIIKSDKAKVKEEKKEVVIDFE